MLKLSKLYCNNEDIFPDIIFHKGINVVFAKAEKKDKKTDSHSLGKTTLLRLIKFLLLKKYDKSIQFLKKPCFEGNIFFLEIEYSAGQYLTIRRPVKGLIAIHLHNAPTCLSEYPDVEWKHKKLSLKNAIETLDKYLKIDQGTQYNYRKGLRYCFKEQNQYSEEFKIDASYIGDDWKPYLASKLGFPLDIFIKKHEINRKIKKLKDARRELKDVEDESINVLNLEISVRESELKKIKEEIDNFKFVKSDQKISKNLADEVAATINKLNIDLYNIDQQLNSIEKSLTTMFEFDLEKVTELFDQVELFFPDKLKNGYEDLVELNKEMSSGRKERLKGTKRKLNRRKKEINEEIKLHAETQQKLTALLLEQDAVEKFKEQQAFYVQEEVEIATLKERAKQLDISNRLTDDITTAELEEKRLGAEIAKLTRSENSLLKKAQVLFMECSEDILDQTGFLYCDVNSANNIEFFAKIKDEEKSLQEGHSYKKILSVIFNLVLLILHKDNSFYRFCYHDGLFETLDDRIKIKLINKIREVSNENGVQFILSVLDSDLPLGEYDNNKIYFPEKEIIRELHDQGESGRLFKMESF